MRITIIGGSNSGPQIGWTAALRKMAPEHQFDNRFLGAVGSLFGLVRLLGMSREAGPRPDAIIFEYTLNDSLWQAGGNVSLQVIEETLHDVATLCAREGIGLLFLCLCVRPAEGEGESVGSLFMDGLYRGVARARGADCLFLGDILGAIEGGQYSDALHLGPKASHRVAEALAARLRAPIPVPRGARRSLCFSYIDATQAGQEGPARLTRIRTPVFEGPFIELAPGGASRWRAHGRLVALMVRSTEFSGYYRIKSGDFVIRKNAQSAARDDRPQLMILHYVAQEIVGDSEIIVDLPASEAELMKLPSDLTLMDKEPSRPFAEQRFEIGGIVVYRPRSRLRRWIDALIAR